MARRGILSPSPTSLLPVTAAMFSPPPSAHSLKTPMTFTSPDSAQIWSQVEKMMNAEMRGMGSTRQLKGTVKITEIDTNMVVSIPIVGGLVGSSPEPTAALSEAF